MLFTTISFLVFFIGLYLVFWSIPGRWRLPYLLLVSILFYAAWSVLFAVHFLAMVAIGYYFARRIYAAKSPQSKKRNMVAAVLLNLANLFLFKYFYLFLTILYDLDHNPLFTKKVFDGWLYSWSGSDSLVLPLAMSFYTFQLIAIIVDYYRNQIDEPPQALRFFVFILFFPQLIAGPIMRHSDFMQQLDTIQPRREYGQQGLYLVLLGLIKKVVIADNLIAGIAPPFHQPESFNAASNAIAILGFTAQVYCDFSGYTDMARGLAFLLGLKLPRNFVAPYLSRSCRDLWTRWHVTLSTWLRDYIYIPLGGNRRGVLRNHLNVIITFTLGGLWHGANYTYVIWGFLHGLFLVMERLVEDGLQKIRGPQAIAAAEQPRSRWVRGILLLLQISYTYALFTFGALFFRALDMTHAMAMLFQIGTWAPGQTSEWNEYLLGMTVLAFGFNWIQNRKQDLILFVPDKWRYGTLAVASFFIWVLVGRYAPAGAAYIYFQF
ncbi:MAG: MBOAT family protein [Leptospiraceae bacterium]|nr:MBOAT family protein [Leptospiraceae bacterium]